MANITGLHRASARRASLAAIGLRSLALSIGIALALTACGGGNDPSVSAGGEATTTSATGSTVPDSPAPTTPGFQVVEYGDLRFEVPDDWPVYDLVQEPTRCVRFDQHAVYLGHAGADQDCPAQLVGRTDALQIEPLDAISEPTAARATAQETLNGLPVRRNPASAVTRSLIVAFDGAGVVVTVTFADDDAIAQQILGTFAPGAT